MDIHSVLFHWVVKKTLKKQLCSFYCYAWLPKVIMINPSVKQFLENEIKYIYVK